MGVGLSARVYLTAASSTAGVSLLLLGFGVEKGGRYLSDDLCLLMLILKRATGLERTLLFIRGLHHNIYY